MKKDKVLLSEIKDFSGNVFGIGDINDELVDALNKNKKVKELNILSNKEYSVGSGDGKNKKISIRNIKKLKKKRVNFLLVDYNNIDDYLKTFIKDSIYITKDYIYFVTDNKKIKKYYSRYNTSIREIKCSDKTIYVVDVKKAKNNKVKEFFFSIVDYIDRGIELITNMLLS